MKIHHVTESFEDKWEAHQDLGMVKVRRTVMADSGMTTLVHDGKTYEAGEDGAFDVPASVAEFYVGAVKRAGWHSGPSPFTREKAQRKQRVTTV